LFKGFTGSEQEKRKRVVEYIFRGFKEKISLEEKYFVIPVQEGRFRE